jgi:hypothetical protein
MTEDRKRPGESWESFTERRIREAQAQGAFDRLPGFGKPLEGLDEGDENWWIKQKLKRENINAVPPILEARLQIERTLEEIGELASEARVRRRLAELNEQIRKAHYSHVAGPAAGVRPVDVEEVVAHWREQRAALEQQENA